MDNATNLDPQPTKPDRPLGKLRALWMTMSDVYPSQQDWDALFQSIDEKAATADAIINRVLEQQARLKL